MLASLSTGTLQSPCLSHHPFSTDLPVTATFESFALYTCAPLPPGMKMVQYPISTNFPTLINKLFCRPGNISHCRASSRSWLIGSSDSCVVWIALPSVMPTIFEDSFPVGMAPSCGLMNNMVALESTTACLSAKCLFKTRRGSRLSFDCSCSSLAWRISSGEGRGVGGGQKRFPHLPRLLACHVAVTNLFAEVVLCLAILGSPRRQLGGT